MDIRNEIVDAVIKEIIGPCPNPNYLDEETGEEILLASVHGAPKSRYGAGMLYPQQTSNIEMEGAEQGIGAETIDEGDSDSNDNQDLTELEKNKRLDIIPD